MTLDKICWRKDPHLKDLTKIFLILGLLCFFQLTAIAQVGVGANFGIESDAYSGDVISGVNTDDWFYNGISGAGVVDEATAAAMGYAALLAANNNIAFDLRQSIPNYASNNGYIWYSTRYARDYVTYNSNDQTVFVGGSKNGQDPSVRWKTSSGSIPAKTDLVDAGVHMRRDGVDVTDDLWVSLMVSTLDFAGDHFVDFELFVTELASTGTGFTNSGSQEGHTAWEFDASGNVTQIGDMVVGFSYTGQTVTGVEVRLWVDRADFNPGTSPGGTSTFVWGATILGGSTYGYGEIVVPGTSILSKVNALATQGPPWGTTNTSGYSLNYSAKSFAEVSLNFRELGFDPQLLFGSGAACDSPFSAVLVKSRSSNTFDSALQDYIGPLDFLGSAAGTQVNTAITDPGDFDSCNTGETFTLQAEFLSPSADYTWYSLTPGVVFPANGLSEISGIGMDNVLIDTPGEYQLGIAPLDGCTPVTDPSDIIGVWSIPCPGDDSYNTMIDVPLSVNATGILANDTDNDVGDSLTVNTTPTVDVSNGTLILGADGSFTYTPDPGFIGPDTFTYQTCDTHGLCSTAQVTIDVTPRKTMITNRKITYRVNRN